MKKRIYFLFGFILLITGTNLLYENGLQFSKGHTQSNYKQNRVQAFPMSRPIYMTVPEKGESFGTLDIPALQMSLPIYEGTDKQELRKGVGHYRKSVLPGQVNNCVLSGHNDSVFRRLDEVREGDDLIIKTSAGIFTYRVTNIRITDQNDRTVIIPTSKAALTITTCYPFRYIGHTPQRYVVFASLVAKHTHTKAKTA